MALHTGNLCFDDLEEVRPEGVLGIGRWMARHSSNSPDEVRRWNVTDSTGLMANDRYGVCVTEPVGLTGSEWEVVFREWAGVVSTRWAVIDVCDLVEADTEVVLLLGESGKSRRRRGRGRVVPLGRRWRVVVAAPSLLALTLVAFTSLLESSDLG